MLKGQTLFTGLLAGVLLSSAASVWAADAEGYVIDSSGQPVVTKDKGGPGGCVVAAPHHRTGDFAACGSDGDDDGDGVSNSKDKCPNTPKGMAVDENGCPLDSDGDGVPDTQDKCPNTPAGVKVDAYGCPLDSDGDGVPDYMDDCPNTPADLIHKVNERGCAPIDTIVRANISDAVLFDFDKSTLKASGAQVLDAVVARIINEDAYVELINVVGHADQIGTDAYNMSLSQRRATTVANYLKSKGVSASKIKTIAKGESEATGKTAAERAKERKVVIDIHMTK